MGLETWKSIFEIGGVALLGLTFLFGAGAYLVTKQINERQAVQLRDFDSRLTGAKTELEHQQQVTLEALKKQQEVETELNKQKERAASAEKTLLELKGTLADRSLTEKQFQDLTGDLKSFAGQDFQVIAYWDSKESVAIAERVSAALQAAGWKHIALDGWHGLFGGVVGIQVWTHPQANGHTQDAAKALVAALQKQGLQAALRTQNASNPKDEKIGINVGAKR